MEEYGYQFHGKCSFIVFHSPPPHIHSYARALNSEFQIDDVTLLLTINIRKNKSSDQEQLDAAMTLAIAGQR